MRARSACAWRALDLIGAAGSEHRRSWSGRDERAKRRRRRWVAVAATRPLRRGWTEVVAWDTVQAMPSLSHEGLVLLFRNQPELALTMLRDVLKVNLPEYERATVVNIDLSDVTSVDRR